MIESIKPYNLCSGKPKLRRVGDFHWVISCRNEIKDYAVTNRMPESTIKDWNDYVDCQLVDDYIEYIEKIKENDR